MTRVAIQGVRGSFHDQAARAFFPDAQIVECQSFAGLYQAMEEGRADAAVMAVENTSSGGLMPNFDLLRRHPQRIIGEVYLQIHQNLLALPGQRLEDIHEVRTHFMAIDQTRAFFERECPWMTVRKADNTAMAAEEISRYALRGVAAVASKLAAEVYGLEVLRENIETFQDNFTRFVVLSAEPVPSGKVPDKVSICFTLPHSPGALSHILTILSFYDMNLTRIQSMPIPGEKWQYFFYADVCFDDYSRWQQALTAVRPLIKDLDILGEYTAVQK